jgi:hypothetical protein
MARLNVEIIPPKNEQVNQIFAQMEWKYCRKQLTPEIIGEMGAKQLDLSEDWYRRK